MSKGVVIALIVGLIVGFGAGFWSGKSGGLNVSDEKSGGVSGDVFSPAPTESLSGTIQRKTGGGIIVKVDPGYPPEEREVLVDDNTAITRNEKPATLADLRVGDFIFFISGENISEKQKFKAVSIYVKVPAQ